MKPKTLPPVRPNAGTEAAYRRRLYGLIREMQDSVIYWVRASYRANEPEIAQDELPAVALKRVINRLARRWQKRFDEAAPKLAAYYAEAAEKRSSAQLARTLRDAGLSVKFKMTDTVRDVMRASINEQVSLIKSIPAQYFTDVEGLVMRSVQAGRDLSTLTKDLEERYGVTRRRAAIIARDQNNKATSTISRARTLEAGITEAVWLHSGGGKEPRPNHVRFGREKKRYDVAKGMWDPDANGKGKGEFIFPGQLINCLPGDSEIEFAYRVEVAYRRWYSGDLAEIVTDTGKRFRATPNHPVLTPHGWRPVGLLNEGDYVIEVAKDIPSFFERLPFFPRLEDDVDRAVASVSEVFSALSVIENSHEVARGGYFHGDVTDGDVDVVFAARPLSFGIKAAKPQRLLDLGFVKSSLAHLSVRALNGCLIRLFMPAARFVRGLSEAFSTGGAFAFHPYAVSVGSSPYLSADAQDTRCDSAPSDPVFLLEGQEACPSFVFPTKAQRIVSARVSSFVGHVFNLQTEKGWYVSGGIINHNCRCVSKPVVSGFS